MIKSKIFVTKPTRKMAARQPRDEYLNWKEHANSVLEEMWKIPPPGERLEALKAYFKRTLGATENSKIDTITQSSMEQAFKVHIDRKERDKIMAMRSADRSKQITERKRGMF